MISHSSRLFGNHARFVQTDVEQVEFTVVDFVDMTLICGTESRIYIVVVLYYRKCHLSARPRCAYFPHG